jgi:hypothetical protein
MRGHARDVHVAGFRLHEEQHVEPFQGDGVDVEQIGGRDPVGVRFQERPPGGVGTPGCGWDPPLFQDSADRALSDAVARAPQLAVDSPVSPAGIIAGHRDDQVADLLGERRSAW